MAQTVKLKRSNTAGTIPTTSNLALGEVAINTKDGKFFLRKHVDGSTGDAIHAYAPQGLNAFGTQELVVKVVTKTTAHPNHGNGDSDGYTIQGLEGPFLALIPGNTYKFDVSDSTNSSHPLRFYLDAAKATAYTTGVTTSGTAGNSGAYVQIAVTTSTPQVLYYQSSSESLMGSAAYVASDAIAANAVGTSQIAQNSITSSEIPNNSIGATQISAAVLAAKQDNLGNNSITAAMISQNTVGISELNVSDGSNGQVLTTNGSGTLSFANASSGTVTETFKTISVSGQDDVVADGATDTLTLAGSGGMTITTTAGSDTVTFSSSTTPADDSVVTAKIADLNVTAGKIAANAVTSAKIATDAVGTSEIAADAVGASEIAANSVGISELNVSDGSNGQVLTTNGSGTLSFATASGSVSEAFKTLSVSGQDDVVADSATDTLTFAAGSNMTITTNASNDTITFASSGSGSTAADDISTGDGTVTIATSSGNITIDTQGGDDDIIFKGTDGSSDITALTLDMSEAGKAVFGGDVALADSKKLLLGAGDDLQIYHDGNNSIIADAGTGSLFLRGTNEINIQSAIGSNYMKSTNGAGTQIYFNDNEKFATVTGGIKVTGNIENASGDMTIDVAGSIILDADSNGEVSFQDAGTEIGKIFNSSSDFAFEAGVQDKDIIFRGNDGGSGITALTLDISDAGRAMFNGSIDIGGTSITRTGDLTIEPSGDLILDAGGENIKFKDDGTEIGQIDMGSANLTFRSSVSDKDIIFRVNDGGSEIVALTLDASEAGSASFNHDIQMVDNGLLRMGAGGDLILLSDGTNGTINTNNGALTIDSAGNIDLDADSGSITFKDDGLLTATLSRNVGNFEIMVNQSDGDFVVKGNDGGSTITALTIDMSEAGAATFNDNVTAFSDERLKDNIQTIDNGLDKVKQLRGVTYTRDEKESIGVIAQEVEKILPEIVLTANDEMGTKSVDYSRLTAVLIEAVKDLSARVKELEDK